MRKGLTPMLGAPAGLIRLLCRQLLASALMTCGIKAGDGLPPPQPDWAPAFFGDLPFFRGNPLAHS